MGPLHSLSGHFYHKFENMLPWISWPSVLTIAINLAGEEKTPWQGWQDGWVSTSPLCQSALMLLVIITAQHPFCILICLGFILYNNQSMKCK